VRPLPELQCTIITFSGWAKIFSCFKLTFQPVVRLLDNSENKRKRWPVMVRPVVVGDPSSKVLGLVVCGSLRHIDDPISIAVCRFKELGDLKSFRKEQLRLRQGCGTCFQASLRDNSLQWLAKLCRSDPNWFHLTSIVRACQRRACEWTF